MLLHTTWKSPHFFSVSSPGQSLENCKYSICCPGRMSCYWLSTNQSALIEAHHFPIPVLYGWVALEPCYFNALLCKVLPHSLFQGQQGSYFSFVVFSEHSWMENTRKRMINNMFRMILKSLIVNKDQVNLRLVVKQDSSFFFIGVMTSGYFGRKPCKSSLSAYHKITHYFKIVVISNMKCIAFNFWRNFPQTAHNMHRQEWNFMWCPNQ